MWLCLNNAFLSVVNKSKKKDCLLVRARRPGDIEKIFPHVAVRETLGTDYRYRADVARSDVAAKIALLVMDIRYDNFKDSVSDTSLHDAYFRIWDVMARLQPGGAYALE
ncbi:MAG: hypothetical protein LBG69_04330 [Zoogloeaceae bacterium]|nr:hypothetical protein [Zoogloeaceae bacterium]